MNKQEYREYFAYAKKYIKLSVILKELNIISEQGNLSRFIKSNHYDYLISIDNLENIYNQINEICRNIP